MIALDHVLHDMRLYKSRVETGLMRESGRIAAAAQLRAMRFTTPGRYEFEIAAELVHEYGRHNATASYQPICGSGANSCILHYHENDARLADGDLLLVDAGAEYQYYASDITRTWPVNGRFSPAQREVYEVVLEAQRAAFAATKPGNHWNEAHEAAVQAITRGLVSIGLLKGAGAEAHQGWCPNAASSCTAPATGLGWMCTTWVITRLATNGACWSRAW